METQSSTKPPSFRYASLNHWRGLAALMVVCAHAFYPVTFQLAGWNTVVGALKTWSKHGTFGVQMFFVISGYCVFVKAHQMALRHQSSLAFLRDRMLRIFPTYWIAGIVAILVALAFAPFSSGRLQDSMPDGWSGLLADVFLVHPYLGRHPVLGVSWSLVYEVGFYIFIALGMMMSLRLGRYGIALAIGAVAALAGVLGAGSWMPLLILRYWPEFSCGIAVFFYVKFRGTDRRKALLAMLAPIFLAVISFVKTGWHSCGTLPGAAAFAMLLIFLKPHDEKIASWRQIRWLDSIGVMSYSLYLIHQPLTTRMVNGGLRFCGSSATTILLCVGVAMLLAILASKVFYHCCEAPLERWRLGISRKPEGAPVLHGIPAASEQSQDGSYAIGKAQEPPNVSRSIGSLSGTQIGETLPDLTIFECHPDR